MAEIFLGATDKGERQTLLLGRANRHGLIAGATGTGKTVTLQTMAEQFSAAGVPVFLSDVKGDLSGICMAGSHDFKHADSLEARALQLGIVPYTYYDNPAVFWDLYGKKGHPIRTTISEMGPLLLSRLLGLNDTQEGVLSIAFKWADDNGLLLLDFDDLQQTLIACAEQAREQERAHLRNRGADRVAFFAVQIPEHRRIVVIFVRHDAQLQGPRLKTVGVFEIVAAGHANARKVALHVGEEHRDAVGRKLLGHRLERDRFAGAGGTRNQPVAVGAAQQQRLALAAFGRTQKYIGHARVPHPSSRGG